VTAEAPGFRDLLAFGLATAEAQSIPLYTIEASSLGSLRLWIEDNDDRAAVDRLAAALGVTDPLARDNPGSTYTVSSRARPWPWEPAGTRLDHTGWSVPFAGALIEVTVTCSLSKEASDGTVSDTPGAHPGG
jgi:hypothetical protein